MCDISVSEISVWEISVCELSACEYLCVRYPCVRYLCVRYLCARGNGEGGRRRKELAVTKKNKNPILRIWGKTKQLSFQAR